MLSHLRMSGTSFRPRQLDVNRPIPVIRKEVEDDDMMTISRGVPELPTGMEMAEEAERHLQEIMNKDMFQNAASDIPIPVVKIVEGWDTEVDPHPFNRPQTYVRYEDKTEEEWDQIVEYDLDDDDLEFLAKVNAGKDLINPDKLESMIDRFEKERSRNGDVDPTFSSVEMMFPDMKTALLNIVFNYWLKKRANNEWLNPMIYRLQRPPDPEDPSPYKAFRTRNEEKLRRKSRKNDQASFMKMKQVRHEMERARTLLEMIKKREKLKRDRAQLLIDIFDKQLERVLNGQEPIFLEGEPSSPEPTSPPIPQNLIDEYGHFEKPIQKSASTTSLTEPATKRKKKQQRNAPNHHASSSSRPLRVMEAPAVLVHAPPPPSDIYELNLPIQEDESMLMDELIHVDDIPSKSTGNIFLGPKIPSFRGRVRMGRGGRILFDRKKNKPVSSGIVPYIETDEEYSPRISTLIEYGDTTLCQSDPLLLLKKLEALIDFKRKLDSKN